MDHLFCNCKAVQYLFALRIAGIPGFQKNLFFLTRLLIIQNIIRSTSKTEPFIVFFPKPTRISYSNTLFKKFPWFDANIPMIQIEFLLLLRR